jgi:amino acid permease
MSVKDDLKYKELDKKSNIEIHDGKEIKLTSAPNSFLNIFKSFVGSGILGLPYGFKEGGYILSLAAFPLTCVIAAYCMICLVRAKVGFY